MGRQDGDAKVASSSIALLQERFRELQRIREKRQEKELLKLFSSESETSNSAAAMHFEEGSKLTFQPEMILPNRQPALQDSLLSLSLNSQTNFNHPPDNLRGINSPTTSSLWPNSATSSSRNTFENSDVDTSLHL